MSEAIGKRARSLSLTDRTSSLLYAYLVSSPECAEILDLWDTQMQVRPAHLGALATAAACGWLMDGGLVWRIDAHVASVGGVYEPAGHHSPQEHRAHLHAGRRRQHCAQDMLCHPNRL